jgi:hypothetical protein
MECTLNPPPPPLLCDDIVADQERLVVTSRSYLDNNRIIGIRSPAAAIVPISASNATGTTELINALYMVLRKIKLQQQKQQQSIIDELR